MVQGHLQAALGECVVAAVDNVVRVYCTRVDAVRAPVVRCVGGGHSGVWGPHAIPVC